MIAIDIETIPNMAMVDCLPEVEAPGNIKDPVKIAAAIEEKKKAQIDKMALSPMFGRVCAVSIYSDIEEPSYCVIDEISDAAELRLIESALVYFCYTPTEKPEICTWNGFNFDIPFLFKRAMLLKATLPAGCIGARPFLHKYSSSPHCDVMQELANWQPDQSLKLDTAAACILGEHKLEHDFTRFTWQIENGERDQIGTYCLKDSELTFRIYQEAKKYLF